MNIEIIRRDTASGDNLERLSRSYETLTRDQYRLAVAKNIELNAVLDDHDLQFDLEENSQALGETTIRGNRYVITDVADQSGVAIFPYIFPKSATVVHLHKYEFAIADAGVDLAAFNAVLRHYAIEIAEIVALRLNRSVVVAIHKVRAGSIVFEVEIGAMVSVGAAGAYKFILKYPQLRKNSLAIGPDLKKLTKKAVNRAAGHTHGRT